MTTAQIVLAGLGLFLLLGGFLGYRAGSRASLYAGSGCTLLLFIALAVSRVELRVGIWIGVVVTVLVCGMMGQRLAKTGKFMPAGMTLVVSLLALLLLLREVAF